MPSRRVWVPYKPLACTKCTESFRPYVGYMDAGEGRELCRECRRKRKAIVASNKYRAKPGNREKAMARDAAYYAANRERLNLYRLQWYHKNKKRIVRHRRDPLAYPFVITPSADNAMLLAINRLVPARMDDRDDVCQEILLMIVAGEVDSATLTPESIRAISGRLRRLNREGGGYARSLDAPLGPNGLTLYHFLATPEPDAADPQH